jgi:aspartate racemase
MIYQGASRSERGVFYREKDRFTMKRIGILGGSSDQATAEYYRRLNQAVNRRLGGWNTAELLVSSMNFALAEGWVRAGDWEAAGRYLADRAEALERAGADLVLCVSNTLHRVADTFTARLHIPFLHIVDPTANAIRAAGLTRVGLLGTKPVMATDYLKRRYAERFGIEVLAPPAGELDELDRIIFDELCRGRFLPEAKARYLANIDALAARGAQAVILGCTEIPLLVAQADRPGVLMFDTVELHVAAAVTLALA